MRTELDLYLTVTMVPTDFTTSRIPGGNAATFVERMTDVTTGHGFMKTIRTQNFGKAVSYTLIKRDQQQMNLELQLETEAVELCL